MLGREAIRDLYRRRAGWYDVSANAYYVLGFREWAYRRRAVRALHGQPGATIVELGCGTGLNFELIQRVIGPEGRLIGVDMTDAMLAQARRRVEAHRWRNVSLVESDIARYEFPAGTAGVIATFALTLVAEYDAVIARAAAALPAGGRLVVLDFKEPGWAPRWLVTSAAWLTRPFGVTADLAQRHPWETMARLLSDFTRDDVYGGFAYVASGTVSHDNPFHDGPDAAANSRNTPVVVGHHNAARRSSCALMATTTVLADMRTAPTAGCSTMPWPASTPAASGIAKMLYPAAHQRFCTILR
jgi:ubiquinone/menaquinone biosynthesis C-methylase UbiE